MPLVSSPRARPLSRRAKRILVLVGGILVIVLAGAIAWSALGSGDTSRAGCLAFTMPGSTGGAFVHECGAAARATCRSAFTHDDRISLLTRPQCRLAGLAPRP